MKNPGREKPLIRRNSSGRLRQTGPRSPAQPPTTGPRRGLASILEAVLRWVMFVAILCLVASSISSRDSAWRDADKLTSQLTSLQRERTRLEQERDSFADPEWQESYWKWRTMSHRPGERYIEFVEPGNP